MVEVLNAFRISCSSCTLESLNGEYLNDTCRLINSNWRKEDYLLQRVSQRVCDDSGVVMKNLSFLLKKFDSIHSISAFEAINIILTKEGKFHYRDRNGFYWRVFRIINRKKLQGMKFLPQKAYAIAQAFGSFLSYLDEFPIKSLEEIEIIKYLKHGLFNNPDSIVNRLFISVDRSPNNEIDYVLGLLKRMIQLEQAFNENWSFNLNGISSEDWKVSTTDRIKNKKRPHKLKRRPLSENKVWEKWLMDPSYSLAN